MSATIIITSINGAGIAKDGTGTPDSNPDRDEFAFKILSGRPADVESYFRRYPPPQPWMSDVCIVGGSITSGTGLLVDVGGSASKLFVGQEIVLE